MLCLNKYKLNSFLINSNCVKINLSYLSKIIINKKNFLCINYEHNFKNFFLRSFLHFFFIMYFYNPFIVLMIKDRPKKFLKLNFNLLNLIDLNSTNKITQADY